MPVLSPPQLLLDLAGAAGVPAKVQAMFAGEHINGTEDRAVLHTALRAPRDAVVQDRGQNVVPEVWAVLDKIRAFSGGWVGGWPGAGPSRDCATHCGGLWAERRRGRRGRRAGRSAPPRLGGEGEQDAPAVWEHALRPLRGGPALVTGWPRPAGSPAEAARELRPCRVVLPHGPRARPQSACAAARSRA